MDVGWKEAHAKTPHVRRQAEFITYLCDLVGKGNAEDFQEAALTFWSAYPRISPTFARRVVMALERQGVPDCCFDPSLLTILARCYFACDQGEKACEHLGAAQKIAPAETSFELACLIGELEVNIRLARSQIEAAQVAYKRLENVSRHAHGGLTSDQLLLGVRISFVQGDLPEAAHRVAQAVKIARSDEQRCRAQLVALKIDEYVDGDIKHELIQLVALEHFQHIRSHSPLSAETQAQLYYRLSSAFLAQGRFTQAIVRLRKTGVRMAWPFGMPELLAAALALADGHPAQARRHLEFLDCQSVVGLTQAEHFERQLRILFVSQTLEGAEHDFDKAEELFRLCEAAAPLPLRQRACLLFASSLIAAGEHGRACRLLQESELQATHHKAMRLMYGCLSALCGAEDKATGAGIVGPSLGYLADLLSDEDTTAVILHLTKVHPPLIGLLVAQGLERALPPPVWNRLGPRIKAVQCAYRARLPAGHVPAGDRLLEAAGLPSLITPASVQTHELVLPSASNMPGFVRECYRGQERDLQILLFGSLQIHKQGVRLDLEHVRRNKIRDLIIILALARGREVSRERLIEELWPRQDSARSLNSFYVVWNALKTVFLADEPRFPARSYSPEHFPFSSARGRCCLLTDYCNLDLDDFDRLVRSIKDAVRQGQGEQCFKFADELMVVYQDEVLSADFEGERLDHVRLHYQKLFVEVMLLVARLALTQRQAGAALPFIERGLAADHSCEELYRLAMHAYALEGRRDDSLRSYYRCRKNLACELGIEPSAELNELFAQLVSPSYPTRRQAGDPPRLSASSQVEKGDCS
ncbi:MAG: bacterial transcriptional activator domain-containing protein [Coriobacteriia bacterium]|nr:bacterial transcriptional activator domain-containing protein [Coriobacteriia bacterium]